MAPTAALPLVVAGPILRRVEPGRVCVWIATSFDPSPGLELTILDVSKPYRHEGLPGSSSSTTVRVGASLYVSLVIATPPPKTVFPSGRLLGYELWYTQAPPQGPVEKRALLEGMPLAYGDVGAPSFRVDDKDGLVLLHGSCRKPDGRGRDALAGASKLISRGPRDLGMRPALLLLTGDQIYANSVGPALVELVQSTATRLCGFDEHIPTTVGSRPLGVLRGKAGGAMRAQLARDAGFNADRGHLFGVTEIVSLYLLSWSSSLWTNAASATREYADFVATLPAVQRALANIPVYMIFDDHEVTDDWNLHRQWVEKVRGHDLGRRTVANALVAYWLCQGWGNDPDRFTPEFVRRVQEYLAAMSAGGGEVRAASAKDLEELVWDFHDWGYVVPSRPPVFVVDTRTERELAGRGDAPVLLNERAWQKLGREIRTSSFRRGDPLVMVTPTPVFGMLFAEALDRQSARDDGPESPDFEHWRFHSVSHHALARWILEKLAPRYTIFLSGDVHYAFSADVEYILDPAPVTLASRDMPSPADRARLGRFYQFTSSPLKNENHGSTVKGTLRYSSELVELARGVSMWDRWDITGLPGGTMPGQYLDWRLSSPGWGQVNVLFSADIAERFPSNRWAPLWREVGRYHRYRADYDAPYYPYSNLGLVTVTTNGLTHTLVVPLGGNGPEPDVAEMIYATKP